MLSRCFGGNSLLAPSVVVLRVRTVVHTVGMAFIFYGLFEGDCALHRGAVQRHLCLGVAPAVYGGGASTALLSNAGWDAWICIWVSHTFNGEWRPQHGGVVGRQHNHRAWTSCDQECCERVRRDAIPARGVVLSNGAPSATTMSASGERQRACRWGGIQTRLAPRTHSHSTLGYVCTCDGHGVSCQSRRLVRTAFGSGFAAVRASV